MSEKHWPIPTDWGIEAERMTREWHGVDGLQKPELDLNDYLRAIGQATNQYISATYQTNNDRYFLETEPGVGIYFNGDGLPKTLHDAKWIVFIIGSALKTRKQQSQ